MLRGNSSPDPPEGFAELVREHWEPVFRYLMHQVRRLHDAEELTQETFLRALSHWEQREPETRPRAWLICIARNLFLDGNSFEDSRSVSKKWLVGDLALGGALTFDAFRLAFTHVIRTREYATQTRPDRFGAVDLTVRF